MSDTPVISKGNFGYPDPGPQNPTATDVTNSVFFVSDEDWDAIRQAEYDYIVLGSGFCALAFVERIYKHKPSARILMLERGPFFLPVHFQNLPTPYEATVGGKSETFPWTLSGQTALQPPGKIQWQHGMVPFFGGRSIMWSAWCPDPTQFEYTLNGWPRSLIDAFNRNKADAARLMNVVSTEQIDSDLSVEERMAVGQSRPVYGTMQRGLLDMLAANIDKLTSPNGLRVQYEAAKIAAHSRATAGIDFAKFSTPAPLLKIVADQQAAAGRGAPLHIVNNCVAIRAEEVNGAATVIKTSRGDINVNAAKVVLAMGSVPPTTFLLNSFPALERAGQRFAAHFITALVGRIPRSAFSFGADLASMELAAIYLSGAIQIFGFNTQQIHMQLSVLNNENPAQNAEIAGRYMPDVVATASRAQMESSPDHILFVFASLGEMDPANADNWVHKNGGSDQTTNIELQALANDNDNKTWDGMDDLTFRALEEVLRPNNATVEYWHGDANSGTWSLDRPPVGQRRAPALVHEASTLWVDAVPGNGVVGEDYRPYNVSNVYVTGGGLFPRAESWNPTFFMVALAQDLADQLT
ncbi:GMC oxidoreductase [Chelatococcus asaccharovorans]|uniref:GMC oxidoreductase n=1 Tax=Chelatococcus asaccharovorans TaxID=28210 RepID=UPI00224C6E4F|nr:GMC oxidoreductase [Chelatococcus asaccharovorans]CAH1667283.1 Choline dehydrogenase-like flavoprotein [Chelatococcus asaccharovorans]CAH1681041.1 Choline dehydrogenase-like flavoprotein [Chelatococcus asaccharovorans]